MAVYGQTLLRLKDRGFKLVDVNYVSGPFARFGEEWVPQWKFEELLAMPDDGVERWLIRGELRENRESDMNRRNPDHRCGAG